ncbi:MULTISPECIES: nitric oxide synthase oxygenase [unclassified Paenibacillus]|uniref:nitric oxide synthase oxygenase n=1 Tax=unclassified Paenibacillus TaxID=185978 RepID=UPI0009F941EB|nr:MULTISPECIES: nitric oxide synthase oxygenase [unclassified Paenibacillus]
MRQAEEFIRVCYAELHKSEDEITARLAHITAEIADMRTYAHTREELTHGARMAWRNSNRCIGRLFWETLEVADAREVDTDDGMAAALFRHLERATNGGKVRPVITVFRAASAARKDARIWNRQLIRYAGYEDLAGIVGDPISAPFTAFCRSLGWQGAGTPFDVLPLVLSVEGDVPRVYEIPPPLVLEVPIVHPDYPQLAERQLKWYAVPFVSDMRLEIGGITYPAAPFNGWYMGTEIGARNLADANRYNLLPVMAGIMGLDTARDSSLWKDRALVELNAAVLHSYRERGVAIVDHHTAAQQFRRFEENERKTERPVTGDWTWLIPPVSPAATHIFHQSYDNRTVTPNFFHR